MFHKVENNFECDEKGRVIVDVTINDKDEILSPYIIDKSQFINSEFVSLLDSIAGSVPSKKDIHLNIGCVKIEENEKSKYVSAIQGFFNRRLVECEKQLHSNSVIFSVMLLLSAIFLSVLFCVHYFNFTWLVTEIIDIITWVFFSCLSFDR